MNLFETKVGCWHRWFAWHPVKTVEGKTAFLRDIWRFYEVIWDGYWLYSDRPDFTSSVFAETLTKNGTRVWRP